MQLDNLASIRRSSMLELVDTLPPQGCLGSSIADLGPTSSSTSARSTQSRHLTHPLDKIDVSPEECTSGDVSC